MLVHRIKKAKGDSRRLNEHLWLGVAAGVTSVHEYMRGNVNLDFAGAQP